MDKNDWNRTNIQKLIEKYKSNTTLWDTDSPGYKSKSQRKCAWISISNEMGLPLHEVQRKINSLLRSFRKERQKTTHSWYGYELLKFLLKEIDNDDHFDYQLVEPEVEFHSKDTLLQNDVANKESTLINTSSVDDIPPLHYTADIDEMEQFIQFVETKMSNYSPRTKSAIQLEFMRVLYQADVGYYENEIGLSAAK